MLALDWVDLTNVASGIFISSVTGSILIKAFTVAVKSSTIASIGTGTDIACDDRCSAFVNDGEIGQVLCACMASQQRIECQS